MKRYSFAAAAALLGAVLLSYAGAFHFPLVFDDAAFETGQIGELGAQSFGPRWLAHKTFALTMALGGGIALLRLENVLLHAAVAVAVFFFCRDLVARISRAPEWPALLAAALFALHPVTVYGVAYLAQRSILMATLFSVLSLHAWLRAIGGGPRGWFVAAAVFFALAMLSKEHAVMLPAVAIALAVARRGQGLKLPWFFAWAVAAMVLVALAAVWRLRGFVGTAYEPFAADVIASMPGGGEDIYLRSVASQAQLFFRYWFTWALPLPQLMSVDVRAPVVPALFSIEAAAGAIAFLGFGLAGIGMLFARDDARRPFAQLYARRRMLGFALLVPWLLYFTEFAAVRVQEPFVLYRSYLWGIGLPIALAVLNAGLSRRVLVCIAIVGCALSAFGLRERLQTFSSNAALWGDAVAKLSDDRLPMADRAIDNYGAALLNQGRYAEALPWFDRALALNPRNASTYANRAAARIAAGTPVPALADYAEALRYQPRNPDVYAARCGLYMKLGQFQRAWTDCETAFAQDGNHVLARLTLGVLLFKRGDRAAALVEFDYVLSVQPWNVIARMNRGVAHALAGRADEARADLEAACQGGVTIACAPS